VKVKVASKYQPVPPAPSKGSPFVAVEFTEMAIQPYVVEVMAAYRDYDARRRLG